jgi:uncharacterized membrane protein
MTGMKRLLFMLLVACGPDLVTPEPDLQPQPQQQNPPQQQQQALTGFPCDVQAALQTNCAGCHAHAAYITGFRARADFLLTMDEGKTLGSVAVERMADLERPMPPKAAERQPTAEQKALISRWVELGMPAGECGGLQ